LDRTVIGNDDTPFHEFEKSADTLRNEPRRDVRLLEMEMGAVEHQWNPMAYIVIEPLFVDLVAFFRQVRSALSQLLHLGVVVDIEVFCAQHLPLETRVLDFVPAEVVELGRGCLNKKNEEKGIFEKPGYHNR
jgi:hypothetical protein